MKLSEMRRILDERNWRLTRSLGQNFLHDGNQLRRIVRAADLQPSDHVLEIGPGLGPLTELLLQSAGHVLAVEKDRRLFDFLSERHAPACNLKLVHGDALDHLRETKTDWSEWKLVANLPYSIASPILVELALGPRRPKRMVATIQSEVANRVMANPGDPDYGLLTLLLRLNYEPASAFRIPAECFFPPPDVDSTTLTLVRREVLPLRESEIAGFVGLVKRGFSQRRKMMAKLLRQDWSAEAVAAAFDQAGLSPQCRAETVRLEDFITLTRLLTL